MFSAQHSGIARGQTLRVAPLKADVTGTGNGERGTEVWERVVSGNLHKNPKWRSKKRERERKKKTKKGIRALVEIRWGRNCKSEQVVCFFDVQPVSFTI